SSSSGWQSFVSPRVVSDMVIGLSDGLTVPFALTAGLSSLGDSHLVITGGFAELVSGAISMGLGGYLAAKGETDYYMSAIEREKRDLESDSMELPLAVADIFAPYNLSEATVDAITQDLRDRPDQVSKFIVKFGHGIEEPSDGRQFSSALTIGLSYFIGGFVPMLPYFFTSTVRDGLMLSSIVMAFTLFLFGYIKTIITMDTKNAAVCIWGGVGMMLVGGFAAGAAYLLVLYI
ncbi:hypothetical protein CANCADRAFT_14220, partial [Tortispora caseinolytica NRRL Y-17796]